MLPIVHVYVERNVRHPFVTGPVVFFATRFKYTSRSREGEKSLLCGSGSELQVGEIRKDES